MQLEKRIQQQLNRLLPSGAGRATMCPTELRYDTGQPVIFLVAHSNQC